MCAPSMRRITPEFHRDCKAPPGDPPESAGTRNTKSRCSNISSIEINVDLASRPRSARVDLASHLQGGAAWPPSRDTQRAAEVPGRFNTTCFEITTKSDGFVAAESSSAVTCTKT